MIDQNPGLTLTAIFLFGIAVGLLLAAWIAQLFWMIERHSERLRSAKREHAALGALEEAAIEINDDQMLCAQCWEERHPSHVWGFQRRTLCIEHLLRKGGQQHPHRNMVNVFPVLHPARGVGED